MLVVPDTTVFFYFDCSRYFCRLLEVQILFSSNFNFRFKKSNFTPRGQNELNGNFQRVTLISTKDSNTAGNLVPEKPDLVPDFFCPYLVS